ncbi:uncharacterized protein AKAW2_50160S [Aspergillus luchuensis]|uniref:Uncharacterized protein n=1 Tax=Aspergillus kawachii TaxID=1069201 RepID=A0A7R7WC82_ASPKA|nr:uncharacterized protein AKAW2_50160S [Aspergillus luchuensis]BCR99818.1 hypothetical protein AKAW2_50160S [Aspergillus luchuensis]
MATPASTACTVAGAMRPIDRLLSIRDDCVHCRGHSVFCECYIRMLVQVSEQRRAMVRKLKIVWQMQDFDHQGWLGDWMQELLDHDHGEFKILEFRLYYLTKPYKGAIRLRYPGEGFGERIKLCQGPLMAREIVQGHLSKRRGKLAVDVCARQSIRQHVRDVVQSRTGPDIRLFDFDLEPRHTWEAPCRDNDAATNLAQSVHRK